jgi:Tfp pilus assembly protein PilF
VGDDYSRYLHAQVLASKGTSLSYAGDVDGAEAAYKESLAAYPDQPQLRMTVARDNLERLAREPAARND